MIKKVGYSCVVDQNPKYQYQSVEKLKKSPGVNSQTSQALEKRQCILVLGMHRSGTSALTRVLNLLGAQLPRNLIPAAAGINPTGFWESLDLMSLHDEILRVSGSTWDDWRQVKGQWLASTKGEPYRKYLTDYLIKEFADAPLFVIKDPRTCRLLPLWLQVLGECDVMPLGVIPVRNPLEVAASLEKRDGFLTAKSCMLWLRHVLEAERGTRGLPRCVVTYDDLLGNPQQTTHNIGERLGLKWSRQSAATVKINDFLDAQHRHHQRRTEDLDTYPDVADWVKHTYKAMLAIAHSGESPAVRKELDDIYTEFDKASGVFEGVLWAEHKAIINHVQLLNTVMAQSADREEALRSRLGVQTQDIQRLNAELSASHLELQRLKGELSTHQIGG